MAEEGTDATHELTIACTRVSAKKNTRRRFVGTKSFGGQKTGKLAGRFSLHLC